MNQPIQRPIQPTEKALRLAALLEGLAATLREGGYRHCISYTAPNNLDWLIVGTDRVVNWTQTEFSLIARVLGE